jgi:carbon storage regulator
MLVLGRVKGESIEIDGGIVVTVVRVKGNTVRLGFTAPQETKIKRGEISVRVQAKDSPALGGAGDSGNQSASLEVNDG